MDTISRTSIRPQSRLFAATARSSVLLLALFTSTLPLACSGSASGNASTKRAKMEAEEGPEDAHDFDKPITAKELTPAAPAPTPKFNDVALLGARHDLSLVSEHANAACGCVKVAIGTASSAAFQWQNGSPHLNDDSELAFAMTGETMACSGEPKGASGASYWGYRISGNDVIVFLEGAREGVPRASAAIIPKPVGDGLVYVAPAKPKFPYGRSLDGKNARCKVGNSAIKRTTAFTRAELGDSSTHNSQSAPAVDDVE